MGEDGEIVDGFAEGFKTLHCNTRTEFDSGFQWSPEFGRAMLLDPYPTRTMISEFINVLVAPVSKAKRTIISPAGPNKRTGTMIRPWLGLKP